MDGKIWYLATAGLPIWWCVIAMIAGGGVLVYVVRCAKKGVLKLSRPNRELRRSEAPGEFWGNLLFLALIGGAFFVIGLVQVAWKGLAQVLGPP